MALGTIVVVFSYFPYAAAFRVSDGQPVIDPGLVGIALVIAPFVFVVIGFVSRNIAAPKQILISMGLLLALGLGVGLLSPVLGATAGFGTGAALTLNRPGLPDVLRNRLLAVGFAVVYTLFLLFIATPAGVLTGAILPTLMVGFADEYTAWRFARDRRG